MAQSQPVGQTSRSIAWWVTLIALLGTALIVAGALIGKINPLLLTGGGQLTDAVRVYADYLFARNLALAIILVLLLLLRSPRMLATVMVLVALIQVLDGIDDLSRGNFVLVPGLLVFALAFLIAASKLFGKAFWRLEAWH